ncbi:MAG: TRAP transporter large permease [Desulfitobacteriia bacterium]|jgi:C4-dicarboxylate transporter DctM subunit
MDPTVIGLIGIIVLLILLFMGMPVGMTMMIVGFFGFAAVVDYKAAMGVFKTIFYTTGSGYTLTVIPLFVLMGQFAYYSGLSRQLYDTSHKWLGHLPGGLSVATVGAAAFFSAICGSSTATAATFATVSLPEMKKYNYDDSLATGSIVAGGTLGILIPPSVGFILYGVITGQSIGKLFAAGLLPGLLLALCYMSAIVIQAARNPKLGPPAAKVPWKERFRSLIEVLPVVFLFVFVIGGIFAGLFTANEGAAIGAFGAFLYLIYRRRASIENILKSLADTIQTTAMIFLIIIGAYVFGYFLAVTRIPMNLADAIASLDVSRYIIVILILLLYVGLGCLMDALAMVLLTVPIFYPVVVTTLGFDPIWFGVIMVMVMEMGMITPPVGMNIYIVKGVAGDSLGIGSIFKGALPHVLAIVAASAILLIFPQIALILPNLLY